MHYPTSSTNKLKKAEQSDISVEQVSLANRENFPQAFRVRLAKAKEVCMLGINVNGIVANYGSFIIEKAKDGCKFRFLLVDPRFFEREEMTSALWPGGMRSQIDLGQTINIIEQIIKEVGNDNVRLSFTTFPPPYSLLMINPNESADSEIQIELYTYQNSTNRRPHFILTRNSNPHWHEFFYREFEDSWKQSHPHTPSEGIKPVTQKAGVVVYRQPDNGKLELLLITARARPQKWIFPLGGVDKGETLKQAAIRECSEESGYIVEVTAPLGTIDIDKGLSIDRLTFFLAREVSEKDNYEKDRQRQWVRPSQLVDMVVGDFKPIARSALIKLEI